MEAKKWLTEKKLGSASKSDLDNVTSTFNSFIFPCVIVLPCEAYGIDLVICARMSPVLSFLTVNTRSWIL